MGRLGRWFARKGNPGGTSRWAAKGFKAFRNLYGDGFTDHDVFRWLIEMRFRPLPNAKHESHLLSKVDEFEGLMGLVVEVLKVETSLSEVPAEAMSDFLIVIEEELKKSGLPHDVLFAQSYGLHYYMNQAYSIAG